MDKPQSFTRACCNIRRREGPKPFLGHRLTRPIPMFVQIKDVLTGHFPIPISVIAWLLRLSSHHTSFSICRTLPEKYPFPDISGLLSFDRFPAAAKPPVSALP